MLSPREAVARSTSNERHKRVVLVVDDDATFRRDMCQALEDAGYVTVGAAGGSDAFDCLAADRVRPDLIITDLRMPNLDGFEFLSTLASDPKLRDIPVLVVSGAVDVTAMSRLRGRPYLTKPFSPDALLAKVATTMR
jgi:CheY-like chemotaxis protein